MSDGEYRPWIRSVLVCVALPLAAVAALQAAASQNATHSIVRPPHASLQSMERGGRPLGSLFAAQAPAVRPAPAAARKIRPLDSLRVRIEPHIGPCPEVLVLPDGCIFFPVAGKVEVAGKTTHEVEQILRRALEKELRNFEIIVELIEADDSKAAARALDNSIFVLDDPNGAEYPLPSDPPLALTGKAVRAAKSGLLVEIELSNRGKDSAFVYPLVPAYYHLLFRDEAGQEIDVPGNLSATKLAPLPSAARTRLMPGNALTARFLLPRFYEQPHVPAEYQVSIDVPQGAGQPPGQFKIDPFWERIPSSVE